MKNFKLLSFFIISSSFLIAQPILTESNFVPLAGESQTYFVFSSSNELDNTVGANVIFDYSNLTGQIDSITTQFDAPSTTEFESDFPSASYSETFSNASENKRFSENKGDSLVTLGIVAEIESFGVAIGKYNEDPEVIMKFPFNYGDSFDDSYSGKITSSAIPLISTSGRGTVSVSADAWGTLKFSDSLTIDSVLRIVQVESFATEAIILQPFLDNIPAVKVTGTIVSYYKPSLSKFPLLSFITGEVGGEENKTVISQYSASTDTIISTPPSDTIISAIDGIKNQVDINVFPNPSNSGHVNVNLNLETATNITLELKNHLGQDVKSIFEGKIKQQTFKLETLSLSKGIYFLSIKVGDQVISKKLVIQ